MTSKHRLALLAAALCVTAPAVAADYRITFYIQTDYSSDATLASFGKSFVGTISVPDAAVQPNALLLFGAPDVTGFAVDVPGALATYQYRLNDDIFPP